MSRSSATPEFDALVEAIAERAAERAAALVHEHLAARGPDHPSPQSPYVSAQEAADLLCTGRKRIYRLVHEGRLEAVKDGGRLLVVKASIERHLRPADESAR